MPAYRSYLSDSRQNPDKSKQALIQFQQVAQDAGNKFTTNFMQQHHILSVSLVQPPNSDKSNNQFGTDNAYKNDGDSISTLEMPDLNGVQNSNGNDQTRNGHKQ